MKKYLKKSLALLLALIMALSTMSVMAMALQLNDSELENEFFEDSIETEADENQQFDIVEFSDALEETAKYGFDINSWSMSATYKTSVVRSRNDDGTNTFTTYFLCNMEEDWLDDNVTFVAENVTPTAYQNFFKDMNVGYTSYITEVSSAADYIRTQNRYYPIGYGMKVLEPFTEDGPGAKTELVVSGKLVTINADPGVRVIKVYAMHGNEVLDYVYLGTNGYDSSGTYSSYDMALFDQARHLLEKELWTDDMTNLEKLTAVVKYINETTHYPYTDYVSKEYNPTFWDNWSIDDTELLYGMFDDVYLNQIMKLQGGITTCQAVQLVQRMATEDLGLTYLYDGTTDTIADGEGVWRVMGSYSTNPTNPYHESLVYQAEDGTRVYLDAQGMGYGAGTSKAACEDHGCLEKIIPLVSENISNSTVTLSQTEFTYDGLEKCPDVTVRYGDVLLVENMDYTVRYSDNIKPGTATITITGMGDYTGTITEYFQIVGLDGFAEKDGNWYYYVNGEIDTEKNDVIYGSVNGEDGWWYVVGGQVQLNYTGVANYPNDYGWWYIQDGKVNLNFTGISSNDYGDWYVNNGKVDFSENNTVDYNGEEWSVSDGKATKISGSYTGTGFQQLESDWFYYVDGQIDTNCNSVIYGTVNGQEGWWYVVNGQVQLNFTGLCNYGNAYGWWYVVNGKVDFSKNGVEQNNFGWWYVLGGQVQFGYAGVANYANDYGWWYINGGKVDFSRNSVEQNAYGWWYVTGGKVDFGYTGVANYANDYGWWYVSGGQVDFSKNSVEPNAYGWWYIVGGKVDFDYTGVSNYTNDYGWWYISGGQVDFNKTSVEPNAYGWWRVEGGKVNFSYTGWARNSYGTWYCVNGKVDFSRS